MPSIIYMVLNGSYIYLRCIKPYTIVRVNYVWFKVINWIVKCVMEYKAKSFLFQNYDLNWSLSIYFLYFRLNIHSAITELVCGSYSSRTLARTPSSGQGTMDPSLHWHPCDLSSRNTMDHPQNYIVPFRPCTYALTRAVTFSIYIMKRENKQ